MSRRILLVLATGVLVALVAGTAYAHFALGLRAYVVHTGSMEPLLEPGDLVIDRPAPRNVRVGEVITFDHGAGLTDLVTHRVAAVSQGGISTKGDANRSRDAWLIRPDQVHGRMEHRVPRAGYLVHFLQQPGGVGGVVCAGIALLQLCRLFFPPSGSSPEPELTRRRRTAPALAG
ncbi:MAG TPA: signal peptidase I [Marmoricola sp.]|nr:signal peptidase I [Marmoricola sp.]